MSELYRGLMKTQSSSVCITRAQHDTLRTMIMKDLKNLPQTAQKPEGFDEYLEIADLEIFKQEFDAWMQHAEVMLKELPPDRMPENFEAYPRLLEAYLERCDTQLRECEALFEPERFKSVSAALSEIRLKILAREIDPKHEKEFEIIRKKALETKTA